jgi:hypothetical protein
MGCPICYREYCCPSYHPFKEQLEMRVKETILKSYEMEIENIVNDILDNLKKEI